MTARAARLVYCPMFTPRQAAESPSKLAIMLSAFVYPGVGQFTQRRILAGSLYAGTFSAALIWFVVSFVHIIVIYWQQQFFSGHPSDTAPGFMPMLLAIGAALLIYGLSLGDTILAHLRAQRPPTPPPRPPQPPQA